MEQHCASSMPLRGTRLQRSISPFRARAKDLPTPPRVQQSIFPASCARRAIAGRGVHDGTQSAREALAALEIPSPRARGRKGQSATAGPRKAERRRCLAAKMSYGPGVRWFSTDLAAAGSCIFSSSSARRGIPVAARPGCSVRLVGFFGRFSFGTARGTGCGYERDYVSRFSANMCMVLHL